ncbi:MAG TPA: PAS domain S-box protein, partial [Gemmatimonadaceae bacterium]|nr:PAS domain S-box protein [Gemmatimonadaceae bacterium]
MPDMQDATAVGDAVALQLENAALRERLRDADEMLGAIRRGEVDALVVEGPTGPRVFTLQGVDAESSRFRGEILRQVSDAVIAFDHDDRITYLNPSAERQYGVSESAVLGRWLNDVYRVQWPDGDTEAQMRSSLASTGRWRGEQVHQLRDGRRLPVELSVTTFRDATRAGLLAVVRDISVRKQAETALTQSEERLRLAVDAARMATWDWELATGRLVWNAEQFRMLGLREGIDEPTHERWMSRVHADDWTRVREALDDAIAAGCDFHLECRVLGASNVTRWVELRGRVDRDARTPRCYGVQLDISERVLAEAALRQNAEMFATIIEQAPGGVYVVDSALQLLATNSDARPLFRSVEPVIGRPLSEVMETLWGAEAGGIWVDAFLHTLRTGERVQTAHFTHLRHDISEPMSYRWETQRVTLPNGQHGVVCYFTDMTEQHRTEALLRDNDQRIRLATEATNVGIWEWNLASNRIRWDAQMFRMYGMPPTPDGTIDYIDWQRRVNPEELRVQEELLHDLIAKRGTNAREFRIRRATDGQLRFIR